VQCCIQCLWPCNIKAWYRK